MQIESIIGDLCAQRDVDVLVNAWNRNVVPWWLLLPQGVSGALKRAAGTAPFRELGYRPLPLGQARITSAGRLPNAAIVHVAGIDMLWRASEASIRDSVRSAVRLTAEHGYRSVALPIIGAGSGGFDEDAALAMILDTLAALHRQGTTPELRVRVVRFSAPVTVDAAVPGASPA